MENTEKVNSPPHYVFGDYELEKVLRAWRLKAHTECIDLNYNEVHYWSSMMEYLFRYPYKGSDLTDLKKAQWFLNKLIDEHT